MMIIILSFFLQIGMIDTFGEFLNYQVNYDIQDCVETLPSLTHFHTIEYMNLGQKENGYIILNDQGCGEIIMKVPETCYDENRNLRLSLIGPDLYTYNVVCETGGRIGYVNCEERPRYCGGMLLS